MSQLQSAFRALLGSAGSNPALVQNAQQRVLTNLGGRVHALFSAEALGLRVSPYSAKDIQGLQFEGKLEAGGTFCLTSALYFNGDDGSRPPVVVDCEKCARRGETGGTTAQRMWDGISEEEQLAMVAKLLLGLVRQTDELEEWQRQSLERLAQAVSKRKHQIRICRDGSLRLS